MKNKGQDSVEQQEEFNLEGGDESGEIQKKSSGLAWFRHLADWALKKFAPKILQAQLQKASSGDTASARFLAALAEKKGNESASVNPGGKTMAQMLAEEPEWENTETGASSPRQASDGKPAQ